MAAVATHFILRKSCERWKKRQRKQNSANGQERMNNVLEEMRVANASEKKTQKPVLQRMLARVYYKSELKHRRPINRNESNC